MKGANGRDLFSSAVEACIYTISPRSAGHVLDSSTVQGASMEVGVFASGF